MSRHIDLIAVAALLLSFALVGHIHNALQMGLSQTRLFRIHSLGNATGHMNITPPHVPAAPRMPRLPHLPRV